MPMMSDMPDVGLRARRRMAWRRLRFPLPNAAKDLPEVAGEGVVRFCSYRRKSGAQ
jgi:hypothetical protein